MNPEAQRIAIAEACGWERIYRRARNERGLPDWIGLPPDASPLTENYCTVLDYCNDLNAMNEAEKVLMDDHSLRWLTYKERLRVICAMENTPTIHATSAQRAEAFLRTIGKWEESTQ